MITDSTYTTSPRQIRYWVLTLVKSQCFFKNWPVNQKLKFHIPKSVVILLWVKQNMFNKLSASLYRDLIVYMLDIKNNHPFCYATLTKKLKTVYGVRNKIKEHLESFGNFWQTHDVLGENKRHLSSSSSSSSCDYIACQYSQTCEQILRYIGNDIHKIVTNQQANGSTGWITKISVHDRRSTEQKVLSKRPLTHCGKSFQAEVVVLLNASPAQSLRVQGTTGLVWSVEDLRFVLRGRWTKVALQDMPD